MISSSDLLLMEPIVANISRSAESVVFLASATFSVFVHLLSSLITSEKFMISPFITPYGFEPFKNFFRIFLTRLIAVKALHRFLVYFTVLILRALPTELIVISDNAGLEPATTTLKRYCICCVRTKTGA